jgi:replicative DNA helicase
LNNELKLLHRAIADRDLSPLLSRGISVEWFSDTDDKNLFKFISDHFVTYSECPSEDAVKRNFPNFVLEQPEDSIDYLIDSFIQDRRKAATFALLKDAINIYEQLDHEQAILALQGGLRKIDESTFTGSRDVSIKETADERYEEYLNRKGNPDGIIGYRTGFPTIDKSTGGIQKGQLIVVAALPKTGKSTICMQMAINMQLAGQKIMFQSYEMTNLEQTARYDALRAKISHFRLMTGSLIDEEESRFRSSLNVTKQLDSDFVFPDQTIGRTVTGIANKIQLLQPDVIFIDGVYLMTDELSGEMQTPRALTGITRTLKNLAMRVNKPIIINTQYLAHKTNKGKATIDSIGYASSFAQDADIVMGLERESEEVDDMRILKIMASRNSGPAEISLTWEWEKGIFKEQEESDLDDY